MTSKMRQVRLERTTLGLEGRSAARPAGPDDCHLVQIAPDSDGFLTRRVADESRQLRAGQAQSEHKDGWNPACRPLPEPQSETDAYFWARVEKGPGCWLWTGAKKSGGYGTISLCGNAYGAHRYSWALHNGPIPTNRIVRHLCNNPGCVRPDHLALGTTADNVADRVAAGRSARGFAKRWGLDGIEVANLFAFRATDPAELALAADPVGPENDARIIQAIKASRFGPVVAAWGANPTATERARKVSDLVRRWKAERIQCLGTTKDGHPRHPLYVRGDKKLEPWRGSP